MKLIKSLLLGTAAGFAATAGVQAADLPMKKAAPVDYVRVCTIGSFTGFVIPGSDVCLKVGGFVRYQYNYGQPQHGFTYVPGVGGYSGIRGFSNNAGTGQRAYASVKMDARTTTEYGLLRSFFDMRIGQLSNAASGGVADPFIDKAYIQFGPWSFGKFQSFFDFYADAFNNIGQLGSDTSVVGAAYTFNAGNGFFATIALEDRGNVNTNPVAVFPVAAPTFVAPAFVATGLGGNAGYRVPDAVVQFLYDPGAGSWGTAQLTGAVHQARVAYAGAIPGTIDLGDTKYGWAVQGGVKFNLGMFGAGDTLYLQAAYSEGALSYVGAGAQVNGQGVTNQTSSILALSDAIAVGPGASIKLTKGFNAFAAFDHYWAPNFDTALWVSYTKVDFANGALFGFTGPAVATARDFDYWQVGAQATWVPVKGIKFAGTVNYYNIDAKSVPQDFIATPGGVFSVADRSNNGIGAALRIQRDF